MKEEDLKTAIANRDFARVRELSEAWGCELRAQLASAIDRQEREEIYASARLFAESSLMLVRVIRAQIAVERESVSAWLQYSSAELEQPRWQIQA